MTEQVAKRILVNLGTGGVGKTTISAAMALACADRGLRTLVITVDPSKRLAQALGLETLPHEPVEVKAKTKAPLFAQGLDPKKTLIDLVADVAPSKAFVERLSANSVFQMISREYSGANDYLAIQHLLQAAHDPRFDVIVLDTPPDRNALSFLNSPQLLQKFYADKILSWILHAAGTQKILGLLEGLAGKGFVSDLFDLARAFLEIQTGITGKVRELEEIFRSPGVGFTLITTPRAEAYEDFLALFQSLKEREFKVSQVILNRSLGSFGDEQFKAFPGEAGRALRHLRESEREIEQRLASLCQTIVRIPEMTHDVDRLEDLKDVAKTVDFLSGVRVL